jgi:predicted dehydrogenase
VRVGVVGIGYWGPNLVRNLASIPGVEVAALCDLVAERAELCARRFAPAARIDRDHRAMLAEAALDAVAVVTPIRTHYQIAAAALDAGVHVFVEKPLAATGTECELLAALARRAGRVLMAGHVYRYSPAVRWIKDFLDRGELGRLLYVCSQRLSLGRIQQDLNALWSFAPHDVSILDHLFDGRAPETVSARGFSYLTSGIADVVFMTLDYPGRVGVHLHLGWLDPRKVRQMTFVGTRRMLVFDDVSLDSKVQIYDKGIEQLEARLDSPESFAEFQFQVRTGDLVVPALPFAEPLQLECQHFVDCVRGGTRPLSDAASGLRVVRVLEAAERSLQQGGAPAEP